MKKYKKTSLILTGMSATAMILLFFATKESNAYIINNAEHIYTTSVVILIYSFLLGAVVTVGVIFGLSISALTSNSEEHFFEKIKKEVKAKKIGFAGALLWMMTLLFAFSSLITLTSTLIYNSVLSFQEILILLFSTAIFGFGAYKNRYTKGLTVRVGKFIINHGSSSDQDSEDKEQSSQINPLSANQENRR